MRDQLISKARVSRIVVVLLALLAAGVPGRVTTTALAQTAKSKADKPQAAKPADIDRNGVLILTRGAILALDQANKTGNYTVLRDLGAPGFQANDAARLSEIFATHRQQQFDLGAVAVLEPQLTLMPQIEPNGMLHMAGYFPSLPLQVDFELLFAPVDRQWRLFGISVNLSKGGLQAPEAQDKPAAAGPAVTPDAPTAEVKAKPKS
ncbi:hypothetical protein J2X13_004976 [Aminobacter aminovorans]|nr:hypothetical protein [Aminobacter aminovorans]